MKKFYKMFFILFFFFSIYPKVGSGKKLPRPSVSLSSSPTTTPSGIMSSNLNIL